MTAKEALRDLVNDLSEQDAIDAYEILADIFQTPAERPAVSEAEMASVLRGIAELDAGLGIPHSEVKRRLELR